MAAAEPSETVENSVVVPPSKTEREGCWLAKDAYWSCLNTLGDDEGCSSFRQQYETSCKKAWVRYFDKQNEFQKFKAQREAKKKLAIENEYQKIKAQQDAKKAAEAADASGAPSAPSGS